MMILDECPDFDSDGIPDACDDDDDNDGISDECDATYRRASPEAVQWLTSDGGNILLRVGWT